MEYLLWVIVALVSYSLIGPVVKLIEEDVPSETDVFVTTAVMLLVTVGSIVAFDSLASTTVSSRSLLFAVAGGMFLAGGVIAYFRALKDGPVSVVVPIFGLFIVMSSLIGILFFQESYSLQKIAGILLAVVAIYITSRSSR